MAKIDLEKGDMNYNRATDYDDYNIYGDHIVNGREISYLQEYIGDINNNGSIDGFDISTIDNIIHGKQ